MAKLTALPEAAIISGFKGTIDFYLHDGVPCARRWPRSPGQRRAPAVEAQWAAFRIASRAWTSLDPETRRTYEEMAVGTTYSARDVFTRSYISGLFAYPTGEEV